MRLTSLAAAGLLALFGQSLSATAQQFFGEYFALIGPQDLYNSSGARLGSFCAVIQQDRANFHRFGIRHDGDQSDPFFGSRAARARITQVCYVRPGHEYVRNAVMAGQTKYVWVRVFGSNGVITGVEVGEGAG